MKKSNRKIREPKEAENTYKVIYQSGVDDKIYWTLIHARNLIEVEDLFNNEFYTDKSDILEIIKQ